MSFTSDEVNYLIYRYLKESGFDHSAFTFGHESTVIKHDINPSDVPTGSLINIIQKGLLYQEIEMEIKADDPKAEIEPPVLVKPLHHVPKERKRASSSANKQRMEMEHNGSPPEGTPGQIIQLDGHTSEVFNCEWNPASNFVASCSGDSTARIWKLAFGKHGIDIEKTLRDTLVLKHVPKDSNETTNVVSLNWNSKGTLLATGAYSGTAYIWNIKGEIVHQLYYHNQPIFSIKWNNAGDLLLTGSIDTQVAVWDAANGVVRREYKASDKILDVDWRSNEEFAIGTSDGLVIVYNINKEKAVISYAAHSSDVNSVQWSPDGSILASCSDDNTAKLWSLESKKPLHVLDLHQQPVYALKWSPTGPKSANPNMPLLIATASFDKTARLWDAATGKCLFTLEKHTETVNSIAFSPNGKYIASASFDKFVHVWSTKDGSLFKSYQCKGSILEVSWDHSSQKIAAASSDNSVFIMDINV